jgi:hypothetical protein
MTTSSLTILYIYSLKIAYYKKEKRKKESLNNDGSTSQAISA